MLSTGSVYVFESSDGLAVWSETQKLLASDGAPGDEFGVSVSLYDDVLVVGSYLDTTVGGDTGMMSEVDKNDIMFFIFFCTRVRLCICHR